MTSGGGIAFRSGYKYQLAEDYSAIIPIAPLAEIITDYIILIREPSLIHGIAPCEGQLTIKKGYAWDGPSGPAIDTKSAMRGSLIHDAGYQLLRSGLQAASVRTKWDELYKQCCLVSAFTVAVPSCPKRHRLTTKAAATPRQVANERAAMHRHLVAAIASAEPPRIFVGCGSLFHHDEPPKSISTKISGEFSYGF